MSHVLSILLTLALIGIIIYIIAENDHPVQTLAWVIAIIFLPVVGLVLYFLVGHRPRRKRLVEPGELSRLKELTRQTHSAFIVPAPDNYNRLASLLQNTNQAFPMTATRCGPMSNSIRCSTTWWQTSSRPGTTSISNSSSSRTILPAAGSRKS